MSLKTEVVAGLGFFMVKNGDTVVVEYSGSLTDGTVFDSSAGFEPFEFKIGEGEVIPGFEKAILGMEVDETKDIFIPAAEAYGPYRQDRVFEIERGNLPPGLDPKVGQQLQMEASGGNAVVVTVIKVSDTVIKVDANSPLAGQDLNFQVHLLAIKE